LGQRPDGTLDGVDQLALAAMALACALPPRIFAVE